MKKWIVEWSISGIKHINIFNKEEDAKNYYNQTNNNYARSYNMVIEIYEAIVD